MKRRKTRKAPRAARRNRSRPKPRLRPAGYLAARSAASCAGRDCTYYRLRPYVRRDLQRITPAPAAGSEDAVRLDANLAMRELLMNSLTLLRDMAAEGNLFGVVFMQLIDGFGGDRVCRAMGDDCKCIRDQDKPPRVETLAFDLAIPFTSGGVQYTADFSCPWEMQVLPSTCNQEI